MIPYLERNGKIHPFGIPISHSWVSLGALLATIQELDIKTFFELGVEHGGLASILITRARLQGDFRYVGLERRQIVSSKVLEMVGRTRTAQFYHADIFSKHIIDMVGSFIETLDHPAMIYCDNGDKPRELRTYAPVLKQGDYIAAHDFTHEFELEDVIDIPELERIEAEWLENSNIILFRKTHDHN